MRRRGDRWLFWWNQGYRDGLAGLIRRVPSTYRMTYRFGRRQGLAHALDNRA